MDISTAVNESLAHHRYFGFPVETALPRVLVSIRVNLQRVLDLKDVRVRKFLGVNRALLIREDWRSENAHAREGITQAIGRLAWVAEWEALIVPSTTDAKATNLVIFPGNLTPPESYVLVVNRDQLPLKPPAS